jgi:hypothetical protein
VCQPHSWFGRSLKEEPLFLPFQVLKGRREHALVLQGIEIRDIIVSPSKEQEIVSDYFLRLLTPHFMASVIGFKEPGVWLQNERQGDPGSIPRRGKGFFL